MSTMELCAVHLSVQVSTSVKCTTKGGGCCRGTCESFRCGEKLKIHGWTVISYDLGGGEGDFGGII